MSLPIVKAPKYELTIPSTKQKVKFRPFVVKEEKILLMAAESKDQKQIVNALRDVLGACIDSGKDKLDVMGLPTFDLQYIFLKLRAKSVGENVDLTVMCPKCEAVNPASIDLSEVEITYPEGHTTKIQLTDDVGIVMRYPTFEMMESNKEIDTENIDSIIEVLSMCIDQIYDKENVYGRKEYTDTDFQEFVYSLTQQDLVKMQGFFDTMPTMKHELNFTCIKCGEKETVILRSLDDFFTSDSPMSPSQTSTN
jgi:hypothetical protein